MMSFSFGLIMFICLVPSLIITYMQVYPKNWQARHLILGVKNREEYKTGEAKETVEKIYAKYRGAAFKIVVVSCVISVALLFLRGMTLMTTIWTSFVFVAIIGELVPLSLGNKEMKDLKRRMGIDGGAGITYIDLSNAGAVHALKAPMVILPNAVGLLPCIFALLVDLKVIPMEHAWLVGSFMGTGIAILFWCVGLLITVIAIVFDGTRNEVISSDSDVNANYNRARKKNLADFMLLFLWINAIYAMAAMVTFGLFYSEILILVFFGFYLALIMAGTAAFMLRNKKIEERYAKEMNIFEDDDNHWIGGLFYYNPKDKRLNVEKRVGVGGTINMAHPIGKLLGVFLGLSIVGTFVALIFLGMMESAPMQLRVQDDKVICHHLYDEYVIDFDKIEEVSFDELSDHRMARVAGVGMDTMLKGNFIVDDVRGCGVFLWRATEKCIKIRTAERTYYVNCNSLDETLAIYRQIVESVQIK